MTPYNPESHLTYDDLLRAMTDPSDLDTTQQAHLTSCRRCQRQTEDLTYRYHRLGKMAQQMAPKPRKAFRVPAHHATIGRWHFKPAMALGVLGILIFAFTLWGPRLTGNNHASAPLTARNLAQDDHLMQEVDTLVEDALPEDYQQVAALSGNQSGEDLDQFIDWMVPDPEQDDDGGQPVPSDHDTLQGPLARLDLAVLAIERIA
jgi:hypothetical protein